MLNQIRISLRHVSLLAALLSCAVGAGCSSLSRPALHFKTPEAAVTKLEAVVAHRSVEEAHELFGSDGDYILHTGDPVLDKRRGEKFPELFNEHHRLEEQEDGSFTLLVGKKEWPFPVPLKASDRGWYFDGQAGEATIRARIIGANELAAIRIAREVYLAQRQYASIDRDGDGVVQYATRIMSTPGTHDGLYWPVSGNEELSPLGALVARAADEGYTTADSGNTPQPVRGYLFRLFTNPPVTGANLDVLSKPGSYWLVAYPAAWGKSGIMTIALNERGWVYQRNFEGQEVFQSDQPLKIDDSWTRIE